MNPTSFVENFQVFLFFLIFAEKGKGGGCWEKKEKDEIYGRKGKGVRRGGGRKSRKAGEVCEKQRGEKNKTLHNKERRQLMCFVLLGFFFFEGARIFRRRFLGIFQDWEGSDINS